MIHIRYVADTDLVCTKVTEKTKFVQNGMLRLHNGNYDTTRNKMEYDTCVRIYWVV